MDPQETKIYTAILIAAGVLGIILIYFVITIIGNQRRHLKLQKEKLLVEITTLENERKRIVSDLHDELGPLLSVVKFQVSSLESSDPEDIELIDKASSNLDEILDRIRTICNHLMPQVLVRKGLIVAITEFISDLENSSPMTVSFQHDEPSIPGAGEVHIYRMVQEIVNNAIKHAKASRMNVRFQQKGSRLIIEIVDNGKGFVTDAIRRESTGLGLKNIMSRVDILRGDLYLNSEPGKGTSYTIEIPNG